MANGNKNQEDQTERLEFEEESVKSEEVKRLRGAGRTQLASALLA